jgi:hypothetical protein
MLVQSAVMRATVYFRMLPRARCMFARLLYSRGITHDPEQRPPSLEQAIDVWQVLP